MDQLKKEQIFRDWLNRYYEQGFRVAFRIIGNEEDCRDIVQDAFLKVWVKFDTYNEKLKFSSWFFTIITNICFDRLRRNKNASTYISSQKSISEAGVENTENRIHNGELSSVIHRLADNLSPKQKIVFVLRDMEEMELDEICRITKMAPGQVKANLYYARKSIRKSLISLKITEDK